MRNLDIKQYGFIEPVIITEGEKAHYLGGTGKLPQEIILEDGQYDDYLPDEEHQFQNGIDSYNCTSEGWDNQHSIYFKRKFNLIEDFSARDSGIKAGTRPPGNDPHVVYESGRKNGVAKEETLPWSADIDSIDEYYSYGSEERKTQCMKEGLDLISQYDFFHEWLWKDKLVSVADKQLLLMENLRYSPIAASVVAWKKGNVYYEKDRLESDTHWIVIYGYRKGKYWKIFDSYPPYRKLLAWDYDFGFAKRKNVSERTEPKDVRVPLLKRALELAYKLLSLLKPKLGGTFSFSPLQMALSSLYMSLQTYITTPPMNDALTKFCLAIQKHEGYYPGSRAYRNKNPGNIKYIGQSSAIGRDSGGFCIFPSYALGFEALKNLIRNAATGKSKVYHPDMTFYQFFSRYAPSSDNNNPKRYAEVVAQQVGVPATTQIKSLIV